mmetsp:Transcript_17054/g.29757  ORF Transcript_17054/g.29757 Transcript_17054/m.29757 type:complete len:152 (+) Transcript_17054:3-458(+)
MEYGTLPGWRPDDPEQSELMKMHLHGNGAARTPTIEEDLKMIRDAGFQIEEHFDFMAVGEQLYGDQEFPWWGDLQSGPYHNWVPALFPAHPYVRKVLPHFLNFFASIGLVPEDVPRAAELMNIGGDGPSLLGKYKAITPQYFVGAIKPAKA